MSAPSLNAPSRDLALLGPARVPIGRLSIDPVTLQGALDRIDLLVKLRCGGRVFTPNVDHVVRAEHDAELRRAYAEADLSLVDGTPLLWAARLLGRPLPEKVSGSDLLVPLLRRAAWRGWRVYFLGGGPGVALAAAEKAAMRFKVHVVGCDAPLIRLDGPDESASALHRIATARPDLIVVALGAPKQERWIHRHADALRPAVCLGLGGSLDFLVGRVRRAPPWISRAGLEWLFRLAQEPRRLWRRYLLDDPRFLAVLAREVFRPVQAAQLRA